MPLTITGITPSSGPALFQQTITLTGSGLTLITLVQFVSGAPATNVKEYDGSYITFTCPSLAVGTYDISVSGGFPASSVLLSPGYEYTSFSVSSVSPSSGNELTGKRITINGAGLKGVTSITFGKVAARDIVLASNVKISCVCPPQRAGTYTVTVYDHLGAAAISAYTYAAVPTRYTATMKSLLTNIKDALNQFKVEAGSLDDVQQIKRGVLPPQPSYPTICILPASTRVLGWFSSRRVNLEHEFTIHVYSRLTSDLKAKKEVFDICEECKEILQFIHPIQASGWDINVGSAELTQEGPNDQGITHRGEVPFTIKTKRYLSQPTYALNWSKVAPTGLLDAIYETVVGYSGTTLSMINTKGFSKRNERPQAAFPALNIQILDNDVLDDIRGQRLPKRIVIFNVFSRLTGKEDAMDSCLDAIDALQDIIWTNIYWTGAENSEIELIQYGQGQVDQTLLYQGVINMIVNSRELTPLTQQ